MTLSEILGLAVSPAIKLCTFTYRKLKGPDPVDVLKRREKWKREFEERLPKPNKYGVRCDAIIRDIKRMDRYPKPDDEGKGISPWFKVEMKGLYHRGIEVFTSMPYSIKPLLTDGWTFCHYGDPEAVMAYPVGRIPFDLIEHVDWEGDGYYPDPHNLLSVQRRSTL